MSHTPGPWELDSAKDRDGRHFIVHGPIPTGINPDFGYPVCDTSNRHHCISPKEDAANASLIAAAPELAKELKHATDHIRDLRIVIEQAREMGLTLHMCGVTYDQDRALALLAKATGGGA